MKLLIIRHGQSEADILDVHEWRIDGDSRVIVYCNRS